MSDYYAFGMLMVGRNWSAGEYRYGFNGQENDDEVSGVGNNVDFGARMYDSRLGRWLSLDPLMAKYPGMSPYNGMADNPIIFVDVDGRDIIIVIGGKGYTLDEFSKLKIENFESVKDKVMFKEWSCFISGMDKMNDKYFTKMVWKYYSKSSEVDLYLGSVNMSSQGFTINPFIKKEGKMVKNKASLSAFNY